MSNAKHSSASVQHFTPREVVDAARETMGSIDLDPASCALANKVVRAAEYFAECDDGLSRLWWFPGWPPSLRVFLNPPGGLVDEDGHEVTVKTSTRKGCSETGSCGLPPGHKHKGVGSAAAAWWQKLADEWQAGRVEQAVFVAFSLEQLQTLQRTSLSPLSLPFCVPSSRLKFWVPNEDGTDVIEGTQPTHANAVIYLPPRVGSRAAAHRFRAAFRGIGDVVIPTVVAPVEAVAAE